MSRFKVAPGRYLSRLPPSTLRLDLWGFGERPRGPGKSGRETEVITFSQPGNLLSFAIFSSPIYSFSHSIYIYFFFSRYCIKKVRKGKHHIHNKEKRKRKHSDCPNKSDEIMRANHYSCMTSQRPKGGKQCSCDLPGSCMSEKTKHAKSPLNNFASTLVTSRLRKRKGEKENKYF